MIQVIWQSLWSWDRICFQPLNAVWSVPLDLWLSEVYPGCEIDALLQDRFKVTPDIVSYIPCDTLLITLVIMVANVSTSQNIMSPLCAVYTCLWVMLCSKNTDNDNITKNVIKWRASKNQSCRIEWCRVQCKKMMLPVMEPARVMALSPAAVVMDTTKPLHQEGLNPSLPCHDQPASLIGLAVVLGLSMALKSP